MNDIISRQYAIEELKSLIAEPDISDDEIKIEGYNNGIKEAISLLSILSSVEQKRTAKVLKHKYRISVSLNVVGEPIIGYEWICENCKKKVIDGDDYCSHCGAKLVWNNEDIPMEHFESSEK